MRCSYPVLRVSQVILKGGYHSPFSLSRGHQSLLLNEVPRGRKWRFRKYEPDAVAVTSGRHVVQDGVLGVRYPESRWATETVNAW